MTPGALPAILLLSTARSGSSVAVNMIGSHPQLCGVPELRLFGFETVEELLAVQLPGVPITQRVAGLLRALAFVHEHEQTAGSIERALQWLLARRNWAALDVFRHLQTALSPRLVVEKSPETAASDQAVKRALSLHPDSRILHLVRHPWATVASMVEAWRDLPYWEVGSDRLHQHCAEIWLDRHARISGITTHTRHYSLIRIEELTGPERAPLRTLCKAIGVEAGSAALDAMQSPEDSPFAKPGPPNAFGGLDEKFIRAPRTRHLKLPSSLEPPRSWRLQTGTVNEVKRLAKGFGYPSSQYSRSPFRA